MAWLLKECFFLKQILGSGEKKRRKNEERQCEDIKCDVQRGGEVTKT